MDTVLTMKKSMLMVFTLLFSSVLSADVSLKDNPPNEYIVKKGDTLWDIAGVFLKSPWKWQEIWKVNDQIKNPDLIYPKDKIFLRYHNGKPYLTMNEHSNGKLSPRVRKVDGFSPITAIPRVALKAFIERNRIVDAQRVAQMPYIIGAANGQQLIGKGDEVFIRGTLDPDFNEYHIYRKNKEYNGFLGLDSKDIEVVKVGTLNIVDMKDDVSRAVITLSNGLVKKSDFIVRSQALNLQPVFYLAAAPQGLAGRIVSTVNNSFQIAKFDGVVIDMGKEEALYAGHVLNIVKAPFTIKDPRTNESITIDDQVLGQLMIVNVFENLSYGIILNIEDLISIDDRVVSIK